MKNILILTDFSDNAYNALFYASKLFNEEKCNFILLNVFNENTPLKNVNEGKNHGLFEQLKNESSEALKATFHRINLDNRCNNHQFELISKNGNLINVINNVVLSSDIDLIVMGNSGVSANKSVFWGSTTINVVNDMKKCPVLAIPNDGEFIRPTEIGFATNYKKLYNAKMVCPIKAIAKSCNAAIRVVHVNEKKYLSPVQEVNLKTLTSYLYAVEHTLHWMPNFASKSNTIKTFMNELGIGMLAMVHSEHSLLEIFMHEPVIKNLIKDLNLPFLIIPAED